MDKAVIVGSYEFIGFHLCEALLQEGIEVYGIHIPTSDSEHLVEEKRLLIGRNSNFYEKNATFLELINPFQRNSFLFLDYYSFYMKKQEEIFIQAVHSFLSHEHIQHSVAILPIQLGVKTENKDHLTKLLDSRSIFYLPTVYGPWQPSNFFFHKALCFPKENHKVEEREWTNDALYIQDVTETILNSIEKTEKRVSYLLKSKIENHWQQICRALTKEIPSIVQKSNRENLDHFSILEVKGISFQEGLERQKAFLSRMQSFY